MKNNKLLLTIEKVLVKLSLTSPKSSLTCFDRLEYSMQGTYSDLFLCFVNDFVSLFVQADAPNNLEKNNLIILQSCRLSLPKSKSNQIVKSLTSCDNFDNFL